MPSAEKMIASADAEAGGIAVLSAQGIEARGRGIGHARVELHFRRFLPLEIGGSKRGGGGRQFEVMLVVRKFRAAAGVAHSVFELRGRAPEAPPERVRFQ